MSVYYLSIYHPSIIMSIGRWSIICQCIIYQYIIHLSHYLLVYDPLSVSVLSINISTFIILPIGVSSIICQCIIYQNIIHLSYCRLVYHPLSVSILSINISSICHIDIHIICQCIIYQYITHLIMSIDISSMAVWYTYYLSMYHLAIYHYIYNIQSVSQNPTEIHFTNTLDLVRFMKLAISYNFINWYIF